MADTSLNENRIGLLIWQTSNLWQSKIRKNIIKYNISERLFFSPFSKTSLLRLYDYKTFVQNNFVVDDNMTKIIIKLTPNDQENKVFISSEPVKVFLITFS